jgi:hypothetical protein
MKTHKINTGDVIDLMGKRFVVGRINLDHGTHEINHEGRLWAIQSLGWDATMQLNYIPPNLPPPDPHKGERIHTLAKLASLAQSKKSAYCPSCDSKSMPAVFLMNMNAAEVKKRIDRGLFVYLKTKKKKREVDTEENDEWEESED